MMATCKYRNFLRPKIGFIFALSILVHLGLTSGSIHACENPTVKWSFDGPTQSPSYPVPQDEPIVVQLTDDNADTIIDHNDVPDVVFVTNGGKIGPNADTNRLTAVDGNTGSPIFVAQGPDITARNLAAADVDNDGTIEILSMTPAPNPHIVRLSWNAATSTLETETTGSSSLPDDHEISPIGIANIDRDGDPEIYVGSHVFDISGNLIFSGSEGQGFTHGSYLGLAADLDKSSPGLELLAGRTIYSAEGLVLHNNSSIPDGWTAIADLDGDCDPEIVLITNFPNLTSLDNTKSELRVLDDTLTLLAGPVIYSGGFDREALLPQPALMDLDADGDAEIVIKSLDKVRALDFVPPGTLSEMWTAGPVVDTTSACSATGFDFQADGIYDVLYQDEEAWYFIAGSTGAIESTIALPVQPGHTHWEGPVIADLDNDDQPEIIVSSFDFNEGNITAYDCDDANPTRSIWNQFEYHVSNISDQEQFHAMVPTVQEDSWLSHNTWRVQTAGEPCRVESICLWPPNHKYVDFSAADPRFQFNGDCGADTTLTFLDCFSSQADDADGTGDGETIDDCVIDQNGSRLRVRSERDGTDKSGRTYTVTAVVGSGCREVGITIFVPHDHREREVASCISPND